MAYSVLIADDEYEMRHGLITYFPWERIGFEVVAEAENGQQALDILAVRDIDVALLDIRMPVMTGLEAAKALHQEKKPVIVVILSAHRDFEYAQQAMSHGVRHYVLKSTRYQDMIATFEALKQTLDEMRGVKGQPVDGSYFDSITNKITQYMENNVATATLEGAADAVRKSVSFVSKTYRDADGRQFGEALHHIRMRRAAKLLRDYRLKTYQVSESIGYATPKSFTRAFKQFYGLSPQAFRSQMEQNDGGMSE